MADQIDISVEDRAVPAKKTGQSRWGRRLLTLLIATAAVGGFAVVVVYSYDKGQLAGKKSAVPNITAQNGPTKMRPKEPGGMVVSNRDKQVYGRLSVAEKPNKIERLLPPPETVVRRPPPLPAPANATANVSPSQKDMEKIGKKLSAIQPSAGMLKMPPAAPVSVTKKAQKPRKPMKVAKLAPQAKKLAMASGSGFRIQIASVRSHKVASQAWSRHKFNHATLFGKLKSMIVRVNLKGKGTFYRVQAGPFANEAAARSVCSKAKKRKIGCIIVRN